ncbi:hypothetical protein A3J19_03145 [Candidatus Daviesbacteria bacterium RIFCSPLOWO2_02_FULL_41_8]|uniref:Uncharacterized protein n=3 Tax=Candidatus Daviesiibacteriota TaxID=1752718 RepID=A0A1F5NJ61_9BACT|nr:MAG: hypothetical protein A2871_01900 [Candidatus Daviesbacteria bacterium RIFCSPHIGHO2_01_FULL_41_23]OGE33081.1 MAG: hypothetical protein A3D83_02950 [Candidatus Daviesbacteria bacterium RIFCSPHIGHO2_02_FULL_41_10]OGE77574.1 MAG: hypothetical protein A3J19_03145 [Candidatus Daviesbacteria bacterium RIFCSPLOWO2_02_FULL_41_8]
MKQKGLAPILIVVLMAALAVGGYLIYSQLPKPIAPPRSITQPTLSPSSIPESSNSAETANWKTYTNTKYGFYFNYPQDFSIKKVAERIFFIENKEKKSFVLWIYENPNNLSLKDYEGKHTSKETGFGPFVYYPDTELVKFQNFEAYYTKEEINCLSKCGSYIWTTKDMIYKLTGTAENVPNQKQTLDQILSTFKFTN